MKLICHIERGFQFIYYISNIEILAARLSTDYVSPLLVNKILSINIIWYWLFSSARMQLENSCLYSPRNFEFSMKETLQISTKISFCEFYNSIQRWVISIAAMRPNRGYAGWKERTNSGLLWIEKIDFYRWWSVPTFDSIPVSIVCVRDNNRGCTCDAASTSFRRTSCECMRMGGRTIRNRHQKRLVTIISTFIYDGVSAGQEVWPGGGKTKVLIILLLGWMDNPRPSRNDALLLPPIVCPSSRASTPS